jgi:hypothetical protein
MRVQYRVIQIACLTLEIGDLDMMCSAQNFDDVWAGIDGDADLLEEVKPMLKG